MIRNSKDEKPWYAAGDPWMLTQTEWDPSRNNYFETIMTQSNGYMGIRGYTEEPVEEADSVREGYLAGTFATVDEPAMGQLKVDYGWRMLIMVSLPELFGCTLILNGETFSMADGSVAFFSRSLNMRNGELTRHVTWISPKGHQTRLQFERFLSSADLHLGIQKITITSDNWSGKVELRFGLDGATPAYFRCGERNWPHLPQDVLETPAVDVIEDGKAVLSCSARGTGHELAFASCIAGGDLSSKADGQKLLQSVSFTLDQGSSAEVTRAVSVYCSRDGVDDVAAAALSAASLGLDKGYEASLAESAKTWQERWNQADVEIDGPARDQAYVRYSAFSLMQMGSYHTDRMSIPARAYAYNRYHGLYYWDSETFLMPFYLHTHPEVAENLLRFRFNTLEGARRNARRLDAPGACYPWMTDSDDGTEQAPWEIGDYVWHQNADIAYAIDQYVHATGDVAFMRDAGLEVIIESARFWMSRIETDAEGVVHLHDTVGPDELDKHGKDNGYTSLMACRHLRLAASWLEAISRLFPTEAAALSDKLELRAGEDGSWLEAAEAMALPLVPGTEIPLQDEFLLGKEPLDFDGLSADEAFEMRHTHRVVKQSDIVLVMYLLQDEFTVEQMRAAYDFYEPMTLHYSSLSYNTHSILATKIGREQQAYEYFMKAAGLDLDDLRNATRDGLHAAALGGTWQTLVYGFLGMKVEPDRISFEPHLPSAWKRMKLSIAYRGCVLKLDIAHDSYRLEVEADHPAPGGLVVLHGEQAALKHGVILESVPEPVAG